MGIAHQISKIEDKPLLIYFSSPSCVYCKKFENEVLTSEDFQQILRASYVFAKINPNTQKTTFMSEEFTNMELFSAFGVRGTPTFVFLYMDSGITSIPGYMSLEDFKKALMYILKVTFENYKESFQTYSKQKDFCLGKSKIIKVSKEDFDLVKEMDKNSVELKEIKDKIDIYKTYLTNSREIADKLFEKGVLRILLLED